MKNEHVKDAAQGTAEDVPQDVAQDLALGLRGSGGVRPPRHATTAAAFFVQLALRWGRNWPAQWHLARAVGKRVRGCRAKRLYAYYPPGRDGTQNAARRPGSGGRPRGRGFEKQGGACTRIQRGVYPYSHFVCLCVCLSVPLHSKLYFLLV